MGLPSEPALNNGEEARRVAEELQRLREQLSSGLSAELAEATREVHRCQADLSEEWGQSYLYHTTIESKSSCHGGGDYTA